MRKIIVLSFVTLDGVIQGPGGPTEDTSGNFTYGGWTVPYFDEAVGEVMGKQMTQPFDLLLGRKTFEIFASYWPHHADDWPGINEVTKYVASNTLTEAEWQNSVFLKGDVVAQIKKLKAGDGPDLQVHGSANFIQTLLANDLVDELWLKIFPLTLGAGKRLFEQGTIPAAFALVESTSSPSGVIIASLKRAREQSKPAHFDIGLDRPTKDYHKGQRARSGALPLNLMHSLRYTQCYASTHASTCLPNLPVAPIVADRRLSDGWAESSRHLFLLTPNPDGESYGFSCGPWSRLLIRVADPQMDEFLRVSNGEHQLLQFAAVTGINRGTPITLRAFIRYVQGNRAP